MFRRAVATAALSLTGLMAAAPLAHADPDTVTDDSVDADNGGGVLNNNTILPVQACGVGLPILSGILGDDDGDEASSGDCVVDSDQGAGDAEAVDD